MMSHPLLALLVVVVSVIPASGQDLPLTWKFKQGQPIFLEMTTETSTTTKIYDIAMVQGQRQTYYVRWTPSEQAEDGSWTILQKMEGIKMKYESAVQKAEYDSTRPNPVLGGNPPADFYRALLESEFRLVVSREMLVQKFEGRQDFIQKLLQANPQMGPMWDNGLPRRPSSR